MSLSHGQELGQFADLASDWSFTLVQPIRSSSLLVDPTLDNMTTTHKFPSLSGGRLLLLVQPQQGRGRLAPPVFTLPPGPSVRGVKPAEGFRPLGQARRFVTVGLSFAHGRCGSVWVGSLS